MLAWRSEERLLPAPRQRAAEHRGRLPGPVPRREDTERADGARCATPHNTLSAALAGGDRRLERVARITRTSRRGSWAGRAASRPGRRAVAAPLARGAVGAPPAGGRRAARAAPARARSRAPRAPHSASGSCADEQRSFDAMLRRPETAPRGGASGADRVPWNPCPRVALRGAGPDEPGRGAALRRWWPAALPVPARRHGQPQRHVARGCELRGGRAGGGLPPSPVRRTGSRAWALAAELLREYERGE